MTVSVVPWRRAIAVLLATAAALAAVVIVARSDGLPATNAAAGRATRWFVHGATGRVVLADGYAGRPLARLDAAANGAPLGVAEGAAGAYLLNRSAAEVRPIDSAALRLGPGTALAPLAEDGAVAGVGANGLLVIDPEGAEGALLSFGGDTVAFDVVAATSTRIAPDGSVWSLADGRLIRTTSTGAVSTGVVVAGGVLTLVGSDAVVLDPLRRRVRYHDGSWVGLGDEAVASELVIQQPGPMASCAWVGADDQLWCVGRGGIERSVVIEGLDIDGADRLAVGGDAAALIRRSPASIVRLDLTSGAISPGPQASVPPTAQLEVFATADLVWVDDVNGDNVWSINPWTLNAISKIDEATPLLGETGEVLEAGSPRSTGAGATRGAPGADDPQCEPDGNGIDDPPLAFDDAVTARAGTVVEIPVTANDCDPDGEAVAVVRVGAPAYGTAEIATGSTVVYRPSAGQTGLDRFAYTIADGNGDEASAEVVIELLAADAPNQAPVGGADESTTRMGVPVVVDVLVNDVDPERDALRIESFAPADIGGEVSEVVGPSGLPGLQYRPPAGVSGTATFTYRPGDALGAVGDPVVVVVAIAEATDANRPPIVRPDSVRVRRNVATDVAVLANDRDPDGDLLLVDVPGPPPPGLDIDVRGTDLRVTARAGAADLVPFSYTVDDGMGHRVEGSVLVVVVSDIEPNRPPLVNADLATAVVGLSSRIDVLANDRDPDGDTLILTAVSQPVDGGGRAVIDGDEVQFVPTDIGEDDDSRTTRFTYTVTDGFGHDVDGDVTVTVLSEALAQPPYARDDSATTERDVPVTLDVLRNDGDPSGGRPALVAVSCPGGGRGTITRDARVRYEPPSGLTGVYRCSYEVTNLQNLRATAWITVSVRPPSVVNEAPTANPDELIMHPGEQRSIDVTANDVDPEGGRLTVVSWSRPTFGSASRDGNVITFVAPNATGVAVINYQVADPQGGVSSGQLVVRVREPEPEPPIANNDLHTLQRGGSLGMDVLANDRDPDGDDSALRITRVDKIAGRGTVSQAGRIITFVPDATFTGDLTARYEITDAQGLAATALATLRVLEPQNRAPEAADDSIEVVNGGSITHNVLQNDVDRDGDPLIMTIVGGSESSLGTARKVSDSEIAFASVPGQSGVAAIEYEISDGTATARATLRITVRPCAEATPLAPDRFFETGYQEPIFIDLTVSAANGQIVDVGSPLSAPSGVYTPPAGENGNVSFNYSVVNGCRLRATGTVTIDVNQDPVGQPHEIQMGRLEEREVPVSDLATDKEPLVITELQGQPAWVSVVGGTSVRIVPAGAAGGTYQFSAVVSDLGGLQATVPITVHLLNRAPVALADSYFSGGAAITVNVFENDGDPDGDPISFQRFDPTVTFPNGATGTVMHAGGGSLTIDPAGGEGSGTFTYTIRDDHGALSEPTQVSVRVNRRPTAANISATVAQRDETTVSVQASDPDGDALTVSVSGVPQADGVSVTISGLQLVIRAANDAVPGQYTFKYRVTDPHGAWAEAQVTVTVTEAEPGPPPSPPGQEPDPPPPGG